MTVSSWRVRQARRWVGSLLCFFAAMAMMNAALANYSTYYEPTDVAATVPQFDPAKGIPKATFDPEDGSLYLAVVWHQGNKVAVLASRSYCETRARLTIKKNLNPTHRQHVADGLRGHPPAAIKLLPECVVVPTTLGMSEFLQRMQAETDSARTAERNALNDKLKQLTERIEALEKRK